MKSVINNVKGRIVDGDTDCLAFVFSSCVYFAVDIVGNFVSFYTHWRTRQDRAVHYSVLSLSVDKPTHFLLLLSTAFHVLLGVKLRSVRSFTQDFC